MAKWRDRWDGLPWWGKLLAGVAGGAAVSGGIYAATRKPSTSADSDASPGGNGTSERIASGSPPSSHSGGGITMLDNGQPPDTTHAPSKDYLGGYTDELASIFRISVPDYAPGWLVDAIVNASQKHNLSPFVAGAIVAWESDWSKGLTPSLSPTGTGDSGHGRTPWQLDDHPAAGNTAFINGPDYADPDAQAEKAFTGHIMPAINTFGLDNLDAIFAAYNAGPGRVKEAIAQGKAPGSVTTANKPYGNYVNAVNHQLALLTGAADQQESA